MRNPGGYATLVTDAGLQEYDTFTCCHCNSVVHVQAKASMDKVGGWCTLCFKPTCPRCDAAGACTPFEKKLEAMERTARLRCEVFS